MGLRELVLGGPLGKKDPLKAKCARVDSLGLAKRRLQAQKAAQEDREELVIEDPSPDDDQPLGVLVGADPVGGDNEAEGEESEPPLTPLAHRNLNDSIRLAKRRLRGASIDIGALNATAPSIKRTSWGSVSTPRTADADATALRTRNNNENDDGDAETNRHHVRFRRASDGEYLTRSRKSSDGNRPGAVGAAAAAMGRLFRRLTANLGEVSTRPRSATPSRPGSPTASQRCNQGPGARADRAASASAWGNSNSRRRSSDTGEAPSAAPAALSTTTPTTTSSRHKRQSAPGELFLDSSAGAASADPQSPPLSNRPAGAVGATAAGPPARDSVSKSRNWLARISRGLSSSTNNSSPAGGSSTRPQTAHAALASPPLLGVTSPPRTVTAAAVAEAPKSPGGWASGMFGRRSEPATTLGDGRPPKPPVAEVCGDGGGGGGGGGGWPSSPLAAESSGDAQTTAAAVAAAAVAVAPIDHIADAPAVAVAVPVPA